jgi:ABC-type amino acid transport substrate-binding protein
MSFVGPLLALLAVLATPLAARGADLPPDMGRILTSGELRVALHRDDAPPFFATAAGGQLDGLDIALARDIAANLGVGVRFLRQGATYDEVVDTVARGEADVAISVISRTLSRARRVRFTAPYATLCQALLLNRLHTAPLHLEADPVAGLSQAGVRVGAVAGSAYLGFAREAFPKAEVVACGTWEEAVADLVDGRLHALLYDEIEVRRWQKAHPEASLYVRATILQARKDYIAMVVNWRDTHLLAWLDLYLQTGAETGALDRLRQRYLKDDSWSAPP